MVIIQTATTPILLVSTDLTLSVKQIIEIYGSRFSIELSIRDLKQHFGFADYQCYSTLAFFRFVSLSCISFGIWMLTLLKNQDAFLLESSSSFHSESPLSFWRLKRAFKRFVCKQIIFQKFSNHADFKKIDSEFEPLYQMAQYCLVMDFDSIFESTNFCKSIVMIHYWLSYSIGSLRYLMFFFSLGSHYIKICSQIISPSFPYFSFISAYCPIYC